MVCSKSQDMKDRISYILVRLQLYLGAVAFFSNVFASAILVHEHKAHALFELLEATGLVKA